jgi:hypothetical protein
MKHRIRLAVGLAAASLVGVVAAPAQASQIVDRYVSDPQLAVDGSSGTALVTYRAQGKLKHVLFWGAVDWSDQFKIDYSGGWGSQRKDVWKTFRNACRPYTGPQLDLLVAACDAPDGSHWALQQWNRLLANYGGSDAAPELHLSHWTGDVAALLIKTDWGYHGRWRHLYGTFTYHGQPVWGDKHTITGVPLDRKGRNVYVDYHDGAWKRENSFLTHPKPKDGSGTGGGFCYLFSPHDGRVGDGDAYRATAIGPGVTPLVRTVFDSPPLSAYTPVADAVANADQRVVLGNDPRCKVN